jgi:tetratricopeptide (TPR) repeat protein
MRLYIVLFFICGLLSSSLAAEKVPVWVDLSTYPEYNFPVNLKQCLRDKGFFVVSEPHHKAWKVLLSLSKHKPNDVCFIANISSALDDRYHRMVVYTVPETEWRGMGSMACEQYLKGVAMHLGNQLKVESGLVEGEKLKKGYFNNLVTSVPKVVEYRPVSQRVPSAKLISVTSEEVEPLKKEAESARILQVESLGRQISYGDIAPQGMSLPELQSDEVQSTPISNGEKTLPAAEGQMQEANQGLTQAGEANRMTDGELEALSEKIEQLENNLANKTGADRVPLLVQKAQAYLKIGDTDEALAIVNEALLMDGKNSDALSLQKALLPPPLPWLERARAFYKKNHLSSSIKLGAEYDSNMILEQKDPLNPTNKDDMVYSLNLGLNYNFNPENRLSYNFFGNRHGDYDNLDMLANTLSYLGQKKLSSASQLLFPVSVSHYSLDSKKLLWNMNISGLNIYQFNALVSGTTELGYIKSSYFDAANSNFESQQFRAKYSVSQTLEKFQNNKILTSCAWLSEDAKSDIYSYQQWRLGLGHSLALSTAWLSFVDTQLAYQNRSYKAAAVGTRKRNDDRWELNVSCGKSFKSGHQLGLEGTYMDNQSNLSGSAYDKYKAGLFWKFSL